MKRLHSLLFYYFSLALIFFASNPVYAVSLRTLSGEIWASNVPIGTTVSLRGVSGKAYHIINTSETPLRIHVDVIEPGTGFKIPQGYEAIPDTRWVRLSQNELNLAPGQEAVVDVLFSFPDDEKFFGKQYVCYIHARTIPSSKGMGIAVGVQSRVLVGIAGDRLTPEQRQKIETIKELLSFEVTPTQYEIQDFPKGQRMDIKKAFKKSFKIVNINDESFKVEVVAVRPTQTLLDLKLKKDSAEGMPEWVHIPSKTYTIEPNTIFEIPLSIEVPKGAEASRFVFIVKVTLLGFEIPVSNYCRLNVFTK